jgi:hypothetical protein
MEITSARLFAEIGALFIENKMLREMVAELEKKIAILEAQVNANRINDNP